LARVSSINSSRRLSFFLNKIVLKELELHPVLIDVFKVQDIKEAKLDFSKIESVPSANYHLSHLGRDLELLSVEIAERGSHLKTDLLNPIGYESHRFNLMIAAGYKIEGYKVKFVPSSPKIKRADLLVNSSKGEFYIENKRANQDVSDFPRYKFFSI